MSGNHIFRDCFIHIIPKCIGPKRYQLFKNQISKNGGNLCDKEQCESALTHVVYDEGLSVDDPEIKYFLELDESMKIVGTRWLSECIKNQKLVPINEFQLLISPKQDIRPTDKGNESGTNAVDSPPKRAKVELEIENENQSMHTQKSLNSELVAELSKVAKSYRSLGDVYRSRNYTSAISIIQKYPKEIKSYEEALSIKGISERMATKIGEIIETGDLRKTAELIGNEKMKIVDLFTQIWGVGPATADSWFRQGHRTLEDVKTRCSLNRMQQIGVKYFDDFQKPIPRHEVEEICAKVTQVAQSIDSRIKTEICGSYRRGKLLCGDVDIVVFEHNENHSHLMQKLLKTLTSSKFISDEFASLEASRHHKFLGICKMPGQDSVFRRLDIFIAPFKEYAPAMIHYTGSATFNVAMRQYAIKKGMHLSEHGLYDKVVRNGNFVVTGHPLLTPSEESIFHLLGVPYKKPEDRENLSVKELRD
ncbi:Uncharacterized protein GBIM_12007 [Gryllus bimaculatus]|nr:Uncharacterized protein GBIM_12007 [Gryllus bimaculatus]